MQSRLAGGMLARVTPGGTANRIRQEPSLNSAQTGSAEPGTPLFVTSEPGCSDGLVFWQVQFRNLNSPNSDIADFGYTAEGSSGEYWLEPIFQTWNIPQNRQVINGSNIAQLRSLAQVQYGLVRELAWSPGSGQLAISSVGAVWLHDVITPNSNPIMVRPNGLATNEARNISYSVNGDRMFTIGLDLSTWNPSNGQQITSISPYAWPQSFGVAINGAGTRAAVAFNGTDINIIDAQTGQLIHVLSGHELVGVAEFTPDGNMLISGGSAGMMAFDSSLRFWDANAGVQVAQLDMGVPVFNMAMSPNGNTLAVPAQSEPGPALPDYYVTMVDVPSRTVRSTIGNGVLSGGNPQLSFNADGSVLAVSDVTSDANGIPTAFLVRLFDANNGTHLGNITLPANVTALAFSPNGSLLAIAYEDPNFWGPNRVEVWGVPQ
jgi:hypothetical protein